MTPVKTLLVFIFALSVCVSVNSAEDKANASFINLFDGQSLAGWDGKPEYFSIKEGAIHAETSAAHPLQKNTFLIYTNREFGDFELRFDYKCVGGNSGMQYRSERLPDFVMKGLQADFENTNRFSGMFFEENGRMFMGMPGEFVLVKPSTDPKRKCDLEKIPFATREQVFAHISDPTAWHSMAVITRGNTFVHIIDDKVMSVAVDEDAKNSRKSGLLGLQVHAGPPMTIDLKNVRIRELK
jgi:hypothetical protein